MGQNQRFSAKIDQNLLVNGAFYDTFLTHSLAENRENRPNQGYFGPIRGKMGLY